MHDVNKAGESYQYAGHNVELIPIGNDKRPFKILIDGLELMYEVDKTSSRIKSHYFFYTQKGLHEYVKSFIDAYSDRIEEVIASMDHHHGGGDGDGGHDHH